MKLINKPISQGDIIYFLITDRFYDGNPQNNQISFAPTCKNSPTTYHGGDFNGVIKKIPYLKNLGITTLWISPVYLGIGSVYFNNTRNDNYHGYWPMDYTKIDPHLIDVHHKQKQALKNLVEELHKNDIKLILDMVVNHTGYHNLTYKHYKGQKPPNHWFSSKEKWDLFGLPDLNHNLADVRDYFCNNILDWIEETGLDGIRMDTVSHIEEEFWYYFKSYVRGKYSHIFFLGEALDFDQETVAAYQREHDFDSLFDFPLRGTIIDVLIRNENFKPPNERLGMQALAKMRLNKSEQLGVLDNDRKYNNANRLVTLLDNHDLEKRIMSWALEINGGDYTKALVLLKYVLGFLFTTRGIPQLYYGTELGMEGDSSKTGDWALRHDMPWSLVNPKTNEPFPDYKIVYELFSYTKKLIRLRKENEALTYGYLFTLYSDFKVYVYLREFRGNTIITAMNNEIEKMEHPISIDIENNSNVPIRIKDNLKEKVILTNVFDNADIIQYHNGCIDIIIPGKTTAIYKLNH